MTLYLSRLVLNPRSRDVRRDLASPYEMHRTLMRAFPSEEAGGPGRVLFRVEEGRAPGAVPVLVQSEKAPHWASLETLEDYLMPGEDPNPAVKPLAVNIKAGQRLRFRLRANPTVKREGKRLGLLKEEEHVAWLHRKATAGGFKVLGCQVLPKGHGTVGVLKDAETPKTITMQAVLFEGVLEVGDAEAFLGTLAAGIGSGKGMGFGLLSVAPHRGEAE